MVDSGSGYDIGIITLTGELVKLQLKKKNVKASQAFKKILRKPTDADYQKQTTARSREHATLIRTRIIAKELKLNMKMGDIEYQADNKKATFYYTAEGRVDFRELIKVLAKEFRVKIEMRQIGTRQESARIGGIGACGRELCCSTWLSNFKSVSTSAARYQNLSINQTKLSGQCGRLKCCLNYELDTYMDALDGFPRNANVLFCKAGKVELMKTDVFKGVMFYQLRSPDGNKFFELTTARVKEVQALNKKNIKPDYLEGEAVIEKRAAEQKESIDFADVTGQIELKNPPKRKPKNKRKPKGKRPNGGQDKGGNKATTGENNKGPKPNNRNKSRAKPKPRPKQQGESRNVKQALQPKTGGENVPNKEGKDTAKPTPKRNNKSRNRNFNRNKNRPNKPSNGGAKQNGGEKKTDNKPSE